MNHQNYISVVLLLFAFTGLLTGQDAGDLLNNYISYGEQYLASADLNKAEIEFKNGLSLSGLSNGERNRLTELLREVEKRKGQALEQRSGDGDKVLSNIRLLRQREATDGSESGVQLTGDVAFDQANQFASVNGRQAFAYRLGALADLERINGRYHNALALSILGLKYSDDQNSTLLKRTFNAVVLDSMTKEVSLPYVPLEATFVGEDLLLMMNDSLFQLNIQTQRMIHIGEGCSNLIFADEDNVLFENGARLYRWKPGWRAPHLLTGNTSLAVTAVLAENDMMYTTGADGNIQKWSRDDKLSSTLKGHYDDVYQLSYRKGVLWSRGVDGTIRKWKNETELSRFEDPEGGYIYGFTETEDGVVGYTSTGNMMFLKDANSDSKTVKAGGGPIVGAHYLNEPSRKILAHMLNNVVNAYDIEGSLLFMLKHETQVNGLSVSAKDGSIVSWTSGNELVFWNHSGQRTSSTIIQGSAIIEVIELSEHQYWLLRRKDGSVSIFDGSEGVVTGGWGGAKNLELPVYNRSETGEIFDFDAVGKVLRSRPLPQTVYQQLLLSGYIDEVITPAFTTYFDLGFGLERFRGSR